jgi:hypothetical protein
MGFGESFADTPSNVSYNVDRFQIYHYSKNIYEGAVVQINYKINKTGTHVDVTLNDYTELSTENTLTLEKRLNKIDTIQKQ